MTGVEGELGGRSQDSAVTLGPVCGLFSLQDGTPARRPQGPERFNRKREMVQRSDAPKLTQLLAAELRLESGLCLLS